MMFGGGLMMIFGLLIMLLLIAVPIVLIVALLGGTAGFLQNRNRSSESARGQGFVTSDMVTPSERPKVDYQNYCNHCGAGLQNGWTHCPQCGAPIGD